MHDCIHQSERENGRVCCQGGVIHFAFHQLIDVDERAEQKKKERNTCSETDTFIRRTNK